MQAVVSKQAKRVPTDGALLSQFSGKVLDGSSMQKEEKTKQKIKFMQNSSGKRIEASQGDLNEVIKATGTLDAHILVMSQKNKILE